MLKSEFAECGMVRNRNASWYCFSIQHSAFRLQHSPTKTGRRPLGENVAPRSNRSLKRCGSATAWGNRDPAPGRGAPGETPHQPRTRFRDLDSFDEAPVSLERSCPQDPLGGTAVRRVPDRRTPRAVRCAIRRALLSRPDHTRGAAAGSPKCTFVTSYKPSASDNAAAEASARCRERKEVARTN